MNTKKPYFCPCCDRSISRFTPGGTLAPVLKKLRVIGGGYRPAQKCPFCLCSDRERLVFLYLTSLRDAYQNKRILHVAPEKHVRRLLESESLHGYICGDLHPRGKMKRINIRKISFPGNSFDLIVCNHVLEHILKDRLAMDELFRVLKPGGLAILQVPVSFAIKDTLENNNINTAKLRRRAFGQWNHVRIYARDDYLNRLQQSGFIADAVNFSKTYGRDVAIRCGINLGEELYLCRKRE